MACRGLLALFFSELVYRFRLVSCSVGRASLVVKGTLVFCEYIN